MLPLLNVGLKIINKIKKLDFTKDIKRMKVRPLNSIEVLPFLLLLLTPFNKYYLIPKNEVIQLHMKQPFSFSVRNTLANSMIKHHQQPPLPAALYIKESYLQPA